MNGGVTIGYARSGELQADWREARAGAPAKPVAPHRLGFVLFLLVTAVMFIRPAEIIPALDALPIYEVLIIGALVTSLPAVLRQLSLDSLTRNPVTYCVVGFLIAVVLSNVAHFDFFM